MFAKFKLETHMNTRFEISRKGFYCASTIDYTTVVHFFANASDAVNIGMEGLERV